jgi:hypothetical protein
MNQSDSYRARDKHFAIFSAALQAAQAATKQDAKFQLNKEEQNNAKAMRARAVNIAEAFTLNGPSLYTDKYVRYFLGEYNNRVLIGEGLNQPLSFNVMRDFVEPSEQTFILKLLPEDYFQMDLDDFLDFLTGPYSFSSYSAEIPHLRVIEANFIGGYAKFKVPAEPDYLWVGGAYVRQREEISIMGVFGRRVADNSNSTIEVSDIDVFPGKYFLKGIHKMDTSNEEFFDIPNYCPVIILTRVSLDKQIQVRYVLEEKRDAFIVHTDDPILVSDLSNVNVNEKEILEKNASVISAHSSLFNLALHLPHLTEFYHSHEDYAAMERHPTKFKIQANSTSARKIRADLGPELCPNYRNVTTIAVRETRQSSYIVSSRGLRVERSGYWKTLSTGSVGQDRNGHEVQGKTWVSTDRSWFEQAGVTIAAVPGDVEVETDSTGANEIGYVYVMRSPQHARDIYKVGFTLRDPEERASDLSGTSGQPDNFAVVECWRVRDPRAVEYQAHKLLAEYRLTNRREFFRAKYQEIRRVIEQVINTTKATAIE